MGYILVRSCLEYLLYNFLLIEKILRGMNGYAWVAMGENTCGVLNDMTQAFMD